jgi:general secretion pathway protein D
MNNRKHLMPKRRLLLAAASLLIPASAMLFGQDASGPGTPPPSFVPPAPSFDPPRPPDFNPPAKGSTPSTQANTARPAIPTDRELLQRKSALVRNDNPIMEEEVGLIRIPEMGTNEVLEMLENFTGKPILRQQTLPTVKITFFSQEALTRGEAITAIESLLALNGIGITTMGEKFLKAVPSAVINSQVPRPWEGSTLDAEPSQMIYEKIFELDFLTTEEAASLLQPLMSSGTPIAFSKSNLILITDALINLQRIERLLPILDKPGKLRTEMLFFELQNLKSTEVVRRLQQLTTGVLKNRLDSNTSFEADERTNQLLVFTHPANVELVTELVERLDIDVAPATSTNVYSIRYADATEVVAIIDQVVSGQRQVRNETGGDNSPAAQAARARTAAQVRQNNQAAASARSDASNLQFSDFLTIVPDERANTIVASGTHNDLRYLEELIGQIDTLLAQVRIEVVITEVRLSENDSKGIDNFGFSVSGTGFFDFDLDGTDTSWTASPGKLYGITFPEKTIGSGTSATTSGPITWDGTNSSIDFVLGAAQTNSDISVLSAPTIVTTHNKEASVSVGEERPVVTGTTGSLASDLVQQQVQYRDIKLELKVTPLIGSDGVVQLEIDQQVQNVIGLIDVNDNPQPIVGTRSATSYVSVKDRELIVLGGLQSLDSSATRGRMAVLGKIPLLGKLFSSKDTEETRNELLIFIRPTIIRTTDDAHKDAEDLINILEGTEEIRGYLDEGTFRESGKKSK